MDWAGIWNTIKTFFTSNGWKILGFFGALVIGFIVVKLLLNMIRKIMKRTKIEKVAQGFIYNIIKFLLYLALILLLLSIIGISLSGILTAISAAVLAIGMALQNNIANLANGIIIVSSHMFKKGDYIQVDGVEGSIEEIHFLFTTIMTSDNKKITIPNSTIVNSSVINSGANASRRIDFTFSVAYESDVEQVKKIVKDVMLSDGRVRLDPAPFCRLKILGASSLDFFANCWVDAEDYWDVYYYIVETVYNEFKKNNISIPYNQIEVRERKDYVNLPFEDKPLQKRVEKERKEDYKFNLEEDGISGLFKAAQTKNKKGRKRKNKTQENVVENIEENSQNTENLPKIIKKENKKRKNKKNSNSDGEPITLTTTEGEPTKLTEEE